MTPAPKTTSATRQAASAAYAESYVPLDAAALAAHEAASPLGVRPLSQGSAALLTLIARITGAKTAVEVGTGTGSSGLAILAGLTPDGVLTSIDTEAEHQVAARQVFADAGVAARRARLIAGAALQVMPKLTDNAYDLVFIDGDPLEYVEYVEQASRLLRKGGVLVMNQALAGGTVADDTNEDDETVIIREALGAVAGMEEFFGALVPVGDGLLVAIRN